MNMKRLAAVLFNPGADEPTAGFRGVLCLLIACLSPLVMDWNTWFFPLLIAMLGGIGFGIGLIGKAWEQTAQIQ